MGKEDMLSYDKETLKYYEELKSKRESPFYGKTYGDIFLFAIAFALKKDISPIKLISKNPNIPISALKDNIWLINALAIDKKNTYKILFESKELYSLAEEYANAGIKQLYEEVFMKKTDFYKTLELWLKEEK